MTNGELNDMRIHRVLVILLGFMLSSIVLSGSVKGLHQTLADSGSVDANNHAVSEPSESSKPSKSAPASKATEPAITSELRLSCLYFDQMDFYRSLKAVEDGNGQMGQTGILLGGIVNHHQLASDLIARFFDAISSATPETIFIIGPNHKRYGSSRVHTGRWSWDTYFGEVETDETAVKRVVKALGAHEDFELLNQEHSISTLMPYVAYTFPESKVVPILLHGNLEMADCIKLVDTLEPILREKPCLLIASIDFSHYLTPEKAYEMDAITMRAIADRDIAGIKTMGNDNLDTPPALLITLMLMDRLGANEDILFEHSNSSDILGQWSEITTSYLTYLFLKQ